MNFLLIIINIVFLLLATVFLAIGAVRKYDTWDITDLSGEDTIENLTISAGILLLITSGVGIAAATVPRKWLFIVYGVLLILCHFLQMGTGILSFLETIHMGDYITGRFADKFRLYSNATHHNSTVQSEVDLIQNQWQCCGYYNVTTLETRLPDRCCDGLPAGKNCTKALANGEDCKKTAGRKLHHTIKATGIMAVFFAIFQIFLGFWSFCHAQHAEKF